ncbi:sigma-54-dependent transcriptional regulator [Caldithrix abyssi]|uniref:Two component, sigma54 specific, transcriptional regulator, Fis family n=2 Tax=Caldithrix abyssi DSM 13497 TaxID=880073 RepID=H1XW99_CALAY|nr:sigma-54 dependent transcriptional regulator [Caldithrix abyssi]EHO43004.1 two component, sigma54 specific, transcriptional regulator, Fis family [Caldithrix abyssi DSM 13497]
MKANILVVDDERSIRDSLEMVLKEEGYNVKTATDGKQALKLLEENNFDIMITDLKMPELDGIQLTKHCLQTYPQTSVIIITAYGSLETAIEALRVGAYDYILKPFDFDDVLIKVQNLIKHKELILENQALRREIHSRYDFSNIVGQSPQMKEVFKLIEKVAKTKSNVLITGKSGTGKELVARAIHYNSDRANKPFVAINCGAIVGTLMESEFFGHKKGSFTGAIRDKDGFFKIANGGTLFLDEVGDIPMHLQVKLLRAIEEGVIMPVGGTTPIQIDVRIIAATNRDLMKDIENGRFRDDLYYRLNVVEIKLPSLNERKEDIPLLVDHFIKKYNNELKRRVLGTDNETMRILMNYPWKGGIRELENVIERALILCEGEYITKSDLPPNMVREEYLSAVPDRLKDAVAAFEKEHILNILRRTGNNKEEAAKLLDISLSSLYRKMDELGIKNVL